MTEDKQSTTNLILIGIVSSIVGGLVVYYLLKKTNRIDNVQSLNNQSYNQSNNQQNNKSNTIYKNNESWEILRDNKGFISRLNVLRDVKTNK